MAFGALTKDSGGIPISTVYVPGVGFVALMGSTITNTDGSSNQSTAVCLARFATTVLNQAAALQTASGNSGDLSVGPFSELAVDVNVTGNQGTSPTLTITLERKGADGIYYPIWTPSAISTSTAQLSTSIGTGCAIAQSVGSIVRLKWVIGGTSTPGYTFSASILGK